MVKLSRRIDQRRLQIARLKIGHLVEDLLGRQAGREEVKHVRHPDPHAPDTRAAATLRGIVRNPCHNFVHPSPPWPPDSSLDSMAGEPVPIAGLGAVSK